jgi:hypothetical protein
MLTTITTRRASSDDRHMKEKTMTRLRNRWLGVVLGGVLSLLPLAAGAADATLQADVLSAYVWRGQVLNDELVVQPSLTAETDYGLSLNVWGNFNTTDRVSPENEREFSEIDLNAAYSRRVSFFTLGVGFYQYLFPNQTVTDDVTSNSAAALPTREVYVSAALEDVILQPTLTVYYDVDAVNGFYGSLGISHSFELTKELSLDLSASIGAADSEYNSVYFGVDEDALNDGNARASVSYALMESLTLTGYIQYTTLLDSDIKDAADVTYFNEGDIVWGGGSLAYSF